MASSNSPSFLLFLLFLASAQIHLSLGHTTNRERDRREGVGGRREEGIAVAVRGGRRVLMSFKETPSGGNVTFECSPSGPCIACVYSEKNDEKFRCSETGYRIPFKCVETGDGSNEANSKGGQKGRATLENASAKAKLHVMLPNAEQHSTSMRHRSLLADSSTSAGGSQAYITYRSCIPSVNEEKLSVLGFEGVMLGLLFLSSSVVYYKRKRSGTSPGVGAVRIPTSSRF